MTLSSQAYAALEAAVGKRFVSKDPAFGFGVSWNGAFASLPHEDPLVPEDAMPLAVVMPATTEEVAAIIKACNRFDLNYRAFSVGWATMGAVTRPNSISIDLRRMNHCEVDERNMMAVIGPYVTAGQLMAEAMKKGLTCHVVGAGATHSPLASATSGWGIGISGASTGHNARNLLSLEWVTPEGEIVRIGSAGSTDTWGIADGPGPGFRGMIRGFMGAMGGLGVFTKIGYRLHPWHGPKQLAYTGQHPQTGIQLDDNFMRYFHAVWDNWEGMRDAAVELNTSAVATVMLRIPPESIGWTLTATNEEYIDLLDRDALPPVARQENGCHWGLLTTAYSAKNDAYNQRVVRDIVQRTGGRLLDVAPEHAQILARNLATSAYVPRVVRPTYKLNTSFGVMDSFRLLPRTMKTTIEAYADQNIAKTSFHSVGPEQNWTWTTERRTLWTENIVAGDENSMPAMMEYLMRTNPKIEKQRLGYDAFFVGPAMDIVGAPIGPNVHLYERNIKNAFDPKGLADPFLYITAKAMPMSWGWDIAKKVIYKPVFRPLLKAVTASQVAKKDK